MAKNEMFGKQEQIIAAMKEAGKNVLWTRPEIMEHFGWHKTQAENALYNAWRTGKIHKHKEPDKEGNNRYALYIKEASRLLYTPSKPTGATSGTSRKRKKGSLPTSKEIRRMFAEHMNSTAQLEDIVLELADRLEVLEKKHEKIQSLI